MMNLNLLLNLKFKKIPNKIIFAFLGVSFIGFLDATYLTAKHFLGFPLPCSFFTGCEAVTSSVYSEIFGVPIALIGTLYYLVTFFATFLYFDNKKDEFFLLALILPIFGFLISLVLIFLQVFIIKSICIYCITSAVSSSILFILSVLVFRKYTARIA